MHRRSYHPTSQYGAALLVFMLILITGTSYFLLVRLNTAKQHYYMQQRQTLQALQHAKQALIGYAATYPDRINSDYGPGYLPCPDRNSNGEAVESCSASRRTTIGWFPFKTLKIAELRDNSGARLWYALADHYKNNPKLQPLNSETPGQLSLNSAQDDIVAVIIAPGTPLATQERKPNHDKSDTEIAHYLEKDNNYLGDDDTKYIHFVSIDPQAKDRDDLNDYILTITRTELMKAVEKRVLAEAGKALVQYKKDYGAYPWLSSFADPKTEARQNDEDILSGCSGKLTDVIAAEDQDDQLTLRDDCVDFKKENSNGVRIIAAGDVVDIGADSSAIIHSISEQGLVIKLADGMRTPEIDDHYRIRRNYGKIQQANLTELHDPRARFITKGIRTGDVIKNETDGSLGRVSVVSENSLTVDGLHLGKQNQFLQDDRYILPQFNAAAGEYKGQLAIHRPGAAFLSPFDITWTITSLTEADIQFEEDLFSTERHPAYIENLKMILQDPAAPIHIMTGLCTWQEPAQVDCIGLSEPAAIKIDGEITAKIKDSVIIEDKNATFNSDHIKRGDIVHNYDDGKTVGGGAIEAASHSTATAGSQRLKLVDHNNDFIQLDIKTGDMIYNSSDGSHGTVARVIDKNTLIAATLADGANNVFSEDDEYQVSGTARLLAKEGIDFIALGIKPGQYTVFNNSTWVRSAISAVHNKRLLSAASLSPDSEEARFSPGDGFSIQRTATAVVTEVFDEHKLETGPIGNTAPDFDCLEKTDIGCKKGERYRIISAAATLTGTTATCTGAVACVNNAAADFISAGVRVDDIVENETDGSFGYISKITENTLEAQLYGGGNNTFNSGDRYRIYHDYGHYRSYRIKAEYHGKPICFSDRSQRIRTVCAIENPVSGDNSSCVIAENEPTCLTTTISLSDNDNGSTPLFEVDVIDYEEDQETMVAQTRFSPTDSTGTLKTENIRYYMDLPGWFINNDWHKLIYVAYNLDCQADDCLQLRGTAVAIDTDAIVIAAGAINPAQDRTQGRVEDYFESLTVPFEQEDQENDQAVTISIDD